MAAEIKYRINSSSDNWLTTDEYLWTIGWNGGSMLWVDVYANGDIKVNEHKDEDWCRYFGRDDKGDFYRYWFTFLSNSGYERRNQYDFTTTVDGETVGFTLKIKQKGQLVTPTVEVNLNRIIQAKNGIKQAIENKGVSVGDMRIDGYAAKIAEIPQGSGKWILPDGTKFVNSTFTEFDAENVDISNLSGLYNMFRGCEKLTSLDLSTWDTSKVTDETVNNMFEDCKNLKTINVSNLITNNIENLNSMFGNCQNLTTVVGLGTWDTSKVEYTVRMFSNCKSLTSVDLTNWDLSNVLDANQMFAYCENLTEVKMGGNPQRLSAVAQMFLEVTTTGTFYYNADYDYSKIIAKLPSTWTAVPM